jgi:hypothetical protein
MVEIEITRTYKFTIVVNPSDYKSYDEMMDHVNEMSNSEDYDDYLDDSEARIVEGDLPTHQSWWD